MLTVATAITYAQISHGRLSAQISSDVRISGVSPLDAGEQLRVQDALRCEHQRVADAEHHDAVVEVDGSVLLADGDVALPPR